MSLAPAALAEPEARAPGGFVGALALVNLGSWAAAFGPIQVLLAVQAAALVPAHKSAVLGLVSGLGAAVSMVANPLFGALSDRTVSRFGRRLPWVAGGAVGGALSLAVMAVAPNVAVMAVGWCGAQAALNAVYAALSAAVPDQVPRSQRGAVSGWLGSAQMLGVVVGTGLATVAGGFTAGYLACAGLLLAAAIPYLIARRDATLDRARRPPFVLRAFLLGFWVSPRRHPDFGWAWLTRFLMKLGNAVSLLYLLYYLRDVVHRPNPTGDVFVLTALYAITVLGTALASGLWSDRVRRRRPFVLASGIGMAAASVVLAVWPAWPGAILAALVLGVGYGGYASVDFALLTEVLPAAADRGRDLGVINIADALPQALAPALAAPVVALAGYPTLYVTSAVITLAGGVLVHRIRSVR